MVNIDGWIFLVFVAVISTSLALAYFRAGHRVPQEIGLIPKFESRCSFTRGRFVRSGANIPFARIALYDQFLVLRAVTSLIIPYATITSVDRSMFGMVKIRANEADRETRISFSCPGSNDAVRILRALAPNLDSEDRMPETARRSTQRCS